jgi:hypothetical protein
MIVQPGANATVPVTFNTTGAGGLNFQSPTAFGGPNQIVTINSPEIGPSGFGQNLFLNTANQYPAIYWQDTPPMVFGIGRYSNNVLEVFNCNFTTGASYVAIADFTRTAVNIRSPIALNINTGPLGVNGAFCTTLPAAKAGTAYGVGSADTSLLLAPTGTMTLTLPAGSALPGRQLLLKVTTAQLVNSASANIVPLAGGAATTAIVSTAAAGKFVLLQADGTNWQIMLAN